jgi:hypothetical protein
MINETQKNSVNMISTIAVEEKLFKELLKNYQDYWLGDSTEVKWIFKNLGSLYDKHKGLLSKEN